jgi:hypothetical protein
MYLSGKFVEEALLLSQVRGGSKITIRSVIIFVS